MTIKTEGAGDKAYKLTIEHNNNHIGTLNIEFSSTMSIQPLKLDFQKCPSIVMLGHPKIQKISYGYNVHVLS